jgi:beta-lactamase class D
MKTFGLLLLSATLWLSACSPNNVEDAKNWEKYFTQHKLEGCFMLFDNGQGTFKVYNIDRAKERFLPASTFKIFNSLVGLQTGVISDTSMVIQLDSVNLTMAEAFRTSSVPYYQEVARRIGKDTMQRWLDSVQYGNRKISTINAFWLDNSLQISPDEELGFVKQLYFNQLPFQQRVQELVSEVMLQEVTPKYKLAYKTGWGIAGAKNIAWIAGWIEENKHPCFFVLNFETEDKSLDIPKIRMEILRNILKEEGFFEGKK